MPKKEAAKPSPKGEAGKEGKGKEMAEVPTGVGLADPNFDYSRNAFVPPGADVSSRKHTFSSTFEPSFIVPKRIANKKMDLVEAVNDFHFAMLNDYPRNQFYLNCLKQLVSEESVVLEIGTGTGLLAMLAAKCGAKHVYAIEANCDMANLALNNIKANKLEDRITILNMLSSDVEPHHLDNLTPNCVLSEVFGTLLLGESAHVYVSEAVKRLCHPIAEETPEKPLLAPPPVDRTVVVPRYGIQFATLICSEELDRMTSVQEWNGIDLSTLNSLKDTSTVVFTKSYGFRFSTIKHREIAPRIPILDLDFATCSPEEMKPENTFRTRVTEGGVVHAVLLTWEAYSDAAHTHVMSTDPKETTDNFPRDMQWGQALQLVEDFSQDSSQPVPLVLETGEEVDVVVRSSSDGVLLQFEIRRVPSEGAAAKAE